MKKILGRFKKFSFWVAFAGVVVIFVKNLADLIGYDVDTTEIENLIMSICGVLVVLGLVSKDEPSINEVKPQDLVDNNVVKKYPIQDVVLNKIENEKPTDNVCSDDNTKPNIDINSHNVIVSNDDVEIMNIVSTENLAPVENISVVENFVSSENVERVVDTRLTDNIETVMIEKSDIEINKTEEIQTRYSYGFCSDKLRS